MKNHKTLIPIILIVSLGIIAVVLPGINAMADGGGFPTPTTTPSPTLFFVLPTSTAEPTGTPIPLDLSEFPQSSGTSEIANAQVQAEESGRPLYPFIYILCVGGVIIIGAVGFYFWSKQQNP